MKLSSVTMVVPAVLATAFLPAVRCCSQDVYYEVKHVNTLTPPPGTPGTDVGDSATTPSVYSLIEADGLTGDVDVEYAWSCVWSGPTYTVIATSDNVQGIATLYGHGSPSCDSTAQDAFGGYATGEVSYTDHPNNYNKSGGKSGPMSPITSQYEVDIECAAQATDNEGYSTAKCTVTLISG